MHAEKMPKLQKRAAWVITSSGLEERSSEIFQMLLDKNTINTKKARISDDI